MPRKKKENFVPTDNFCIVCGRHTNDKKFPSENWTNIFFVCNTCQKVWCGECMGQVSGKGPSKAFRLGRKGGINCPQCNQFVPMIKLPVNLTFKQTKLETKPVQEVELPGKKRFCHFCGAELSQQAQFCQICGGKQ